MRSGKAYVWNELSIDAEGLDTASDWDTQAQLFMGDFSRVLSFHRQRIPIQLVLVGSNGVDKQILCSKMTTGLLPRTPIQTPDQNSTMNFHCSLQNVAAAAGAAGEINFYASFFEYDLDQIQFFPANWSQSVTTR